MDRYKFDNMGIPMDKLEDEHEQSGYNEWDDLTVGSTPDSKQRLGDEVARLLDNPSELLEVDIERLSEIYKNHHGDMEDLGSNIHWYYKDLAFRQAQEYVI